MGPRPAELRSCFSAKEDEESTILQLEKDLRTRVEVLLKQKRERKQELRTLQEREQDLRDLLRTAPYSAGDSSVPSLEELDRFRRHLAALGAEKVRVGLSVTGRGAETEAWPLRSFLGL